MSKAQLERGYRLVELLKQPLNSPMPVEEQVVSIFAGTRGYLDDIPVADVSRFESRAARVHAHRTRRRCSTSCAPSGVPDALGDAVAAFKEQFTVAGDAATRVDPTATDADELGEAAVAQDARDGVI